MLPIVRNQKTYTKDTADVIKNILRATLPSQCILCTWDVTSMYTNIGHDEAELILKECLKENWQNLQCQNSITMPALFKLINLTLRDNVFEFDGQFYRQKFGVSMGSKCSPEIADIVMYKFETELLAKYGRNVVGWQRYRDDIFFIWTDTAISLKLFEIEANQMHASLKFEQNNSTDSVNFLDITIFKGDRFKNNGILNTKIYTKPTNKFQYLDRSSAHSESVFKAFLKGELLRARRNCSSESDLWDYIEKFRIRTQARGYNKNEFDEVLTKLQKENWVSNPKTKKNSEQFRLAYKVNCNESAIIKACLKRHWFLIKENNFLVQCLGRKPNLVWSREKNLSEHLVRARLRKVL